MGAKHNHGQGDVKREAMIQVSLSGLAGKRQYWATKLPVSLSLLAIRGTDDRSLIFFGYSFMDYVDDNQQFPVFYRIFVYEI